MVNYIDFLPDNNLEKDYFKSIAKEIDLDVTIVAKNFHDPIEEIEGDKILLMNGDEKYTIPCEVSDPSVKMIFKQYAHDDQHEKVRPIPLGTIPKDASSLIDIQDRKFDVTFIGQTTPLRDPFLAEINSFLEDDELNCFFGLYKSFNSGLDFDMYNKILSDTKIAICPHGAFSSETFRFFEAAAHGCVVICPSQPYNWIYESAPYVHYNESTPSYHESVSAILSEPDMLQQISEGSLKYISDVVSPQNVANYITSEIQKHLEG